MAVTKKIGPAKPAAMAKTSPTAKPAMAKPATKPAAVNPTAAKPITEEKPVEVKPATTTSEKTNRMAIAALVLGIAGIALGWLIPLIPSILGLIFGIIGLNQIKKTGEKGKGMALTGIILGAVGIILVVIFIILLGALAYFGVMNPSSFN